eukprot:11898440-Karenia_brevis.AAC.1
MQVFVDPLNVPMAGIEDIRKFLEAQTSTLTHTIDTRIAEVKDEVKKDMQEVKSNVNEVKETVREHGDRLGALEADVKRMKS